MARANSALEQDMVLLSTRMKQKIGRVSEVLGWILVLSLVLGSWIAWFIGEPYRHHIVREGELCGPGYRWTYVLLRYLPQDCRPRVEDNASTLRVDRSRFGCTSQRWICLWNRRAHPAGQLEGRARAALGRVCGVGAKARRVMGTVVTPFDSCSFLRTHASSGSGWPSISSWPAPGT